MDELSFTTADTHRTQILHDGLALGSNRNHQARLLRSKDETKQIEIDRVDEDTREFLTQTNFDVENILVVQVRLPSSGIEYVVNKVGLANERIHVQSEYVIKPGPQDETIETELVKFSVPDNQSIEEVVIHTRNSPYHDQNGTTFTASD